MPRVKKALLMAKKRMAIRVSTWRVKSKGEEERPGVGARLENLCFGKEMKWVLNVDVYRSKTKPTFSLRGDW